MTLTEMIMTHLSKPILAHNLSSTLDQIEFSQLRDSWILPEILRRKLARHYLLYWDKEFLVTHSGLQDGVTLEHQGCKYIVILTEPLTGFKCCARVALSFRHPIGTTFGYCLIKPAIKRYGVCNEH